MNITRILVGSMAAFTATLITCAVVTLTWDLTHHGRGTIDWETSLRFAIVLAIILPWMTVRRAKG